MNRLQAVLRIGFCTRTNDVFLACSRSELGDQGLTVGLDHVRPQPPVGADFPAPRRGCGAFRDPITNLETLYYRLIRKILSPPAGQSPRPSQLLVVAYR
jgi:hypothetical protein